MGEIVFFLEPTRTSLLDDVDLLTESPIAPAQPVDFDVVVAAGRPGLDAERLRQGLEEALGPDPDPLALRRKHGSFKDHAGFVGVGVEVAVAAAPAAAYRVRIDFKPNGWIDREVVDAIIA